VVGIAARTMNAEVLWIGTIVFQAFVAGGTLATTDPRVDEVVAAFLYAFGIGS
jgi:hypothetical protein